MIRTVSLIVVAGIFVCLASSPALAIKQFQDEWFELYLADNENKEFAEMARSKAKCYICHQGKKKSNHNPYGIHLVELLDKKKDKKDVEKIVKALKEVGELHSDPKDDSSPTYAELIAQGKLPGGSLEEAKEEPKKTEE